MTDNKWIILTGILLLFIIGYLGFGYFGLPKINYLFSGVLLIICAFGAGLGCRR